MRAIEPSSFMISQMTPAGLEAGETREVDGAFGLPRTHEHAAATRASTERRDRG